MILTPRHPESPTPLWTHVSFACYVAGVVLVAWAQLTIVAMSTTRLAESRSSLIALDTALLGTLAPWTALALCRLVAPWTGGGFRLAAVGLAGWLAAEYYTQIGSLESFRKPTAEVASASRTAWLVRNGALLTFGLGIGLVVAYSTLDFLRRRSAPAWIRAAD